ncbi:zinc-ribbon domain-containing protein [Kitasatospora griseola]
MAPATRPARVPKRMLNEHPVAAQFHPILNGTLTPDQVPYSSQEKVWWQCPDVPAHAWEATPNNRTKKTRPTGCGPCRSKRLRGDVPFERSLAGRFSHVAADLNAAASGFTAAEVLAGAKVEATWKCPKDLGHPNYPMSVNSRTNPGQMQGCPACAGKQLSPERSLAAVAPDVAAEFLNAVNGTTPEDVFSQDNRRYVWQCSRVPGHRWVASPNNRVGKRSGCPYCTGSRVWELNRLSGVRPDLAAQWDRERNDLLTPDDVSVGSGRAVHWTCPKGPDHRWSARVHKRTSGQGCPFCNGQKTSEATSLLALRDDLATQLDAKRSGVSAAELTPGSGRKVWWICPIQPEKHTWDATVLNRAFNGTGCPECNLPGTSAQEIRLAAELSVVLPVDLDHHRIQTAHGTERVDIWIPFFDLIIEFDGSYWHDGTQESDAEKSVRLLTTVEHVVRVRERPLTALDPVRDVVVPFRAPAEVAAGVVLNHLVALGIVPTEAAQDYRSQPGPRASQLAERRLAEVRGRTAERKAARASGATPK